MDIQQRFILNFKNQERELGETEIPQNTFEEFLRSISSNYTMEKYDLFKNNCNNFTNECALFLVGKGIPEHITGILLFIYLHQDCHKNF